MTVLDSMMRLLSPRRIGSAALGAALALSAGAAAAQEDQINVREEHGDWKIVCGDAADSPCDMVYFIPSPEASGGTMAVLSFSKLDNPLTVNGEQFGVGVELRTPLGTFLPAGVRFSMADEDLMVVPFEFCVPIGCRAADAVKTELIDKLKAGDKMVVSFSSRTPNAPTRFDVDVSLAGFTAAFDAL